MPSNQGVRSMQFDLKGVAIAAAVTVTPAWAGHAQAAVYYTDFTASVTTEAITFPGQEVPPPETEDFYDGDSRENADVSTAVDWSIHALWNGAGTASAGPGVVKFGMVSEVLRNLPDRLVTSLFMSGYAGADENVSVAAASGLETLEFTFRIDGTLAGAGAAMNAWGGTFTGYEYLTRYGSDTASIDEDFTFSVPVIDGRAMFSFYLGGSASFFGGVGTEHAALDFTHTAKLTGLVGRDATGGRVALTSVTGTGNADYLAIAAANAAVPEPASWAMMIAGFAVVGAAARRRPAIAYA
jgi:hypothetical protein